MTAIALSVVMAALCVFMGVRLRRMQRDLTHATETVCLSLDAMRDAQAAMTARTQERDAALQRSGYLAATVKDYEDAETVRIAASAAACRSAAPLMLISATLVQMVADLSDLDNRLSEWRVRLQQLQEAQRSYDELIAEANKTITELSAQYADLALD